MKKKKKEKPLTRATGKVRIQKTPANAALMDLKRQLRIEASLDRVRKKALSMKKPDDLLNICKTLYTELQLLGFDDLRNSMINIHNDDNESFLNYDYAKAGPSITHFTYHTHPVIENLVRQMKSGRAAFSEQVLSGKKLKEFKVFRKSHGEKTDAKLRDAKALYYYFYSIGTGALGISNLASLDPEQLKILKRFRNVFDLAYRRYADIQKAEAQAREARIEAALEKVRSRTMAMQKSEELMEAANLLFQQVRSLGIPVWSCGYNIWEKGEKVCTGWMSTQGSIQPSFRIPLAEHRTFIHMNESRLKAEPFYVEEVSGEELADHYRYMFSLPDFMEIATKQLQDGFPLPLSQINHVFNFKHGNLIFLSAEAIPEAWDIFKRFTAVFEQTYTRFLDLQKAEAQAREAQIEAALEKVRSSSLAMHHPNELEKVVTVLFDKLAELGLSFSGAGIFLFDKGKRSIRHWVTGLNISVPVKNDLPYDEEFEKNLIVEDLWRAKEKGEPIINKSYSKKVKNDFFRYTSKYNDASRIPEDVKKFIFEADNFTLTCAAERNCVVSLDSWLGPFTSEEDFQLLKRFARVFEQAYVRFLDLQKAEAQVLEAQIEAALEKVRSRSLAMHKSDELREVVKTVFDKLQELNFVLEDGAVSILIFKEHSRDQTQWIADPGHSYATPFELAYSDHSIPRDLFAAKESPVDYFSKIYPIEEKNEYFNYLFTHSSYKYLPAEVKELILGSSQYGISVAFTKHAAIVVPTNSGRLLTEAEKEILKRFAKVFEQTYTRFLDLQRAEAQSREAQIQLALERVRARTMAMQKSDELPDAASLLFQQVQSLGMDAWSAGYCIWDEGKQAVTAWMSSEGVLQAPFRAPLTEDPSFIHFREAYERGETFFVEEIGGEELVAHYKYVRAQPVGGEIQDAIFKAGHQLPTFQIFHCAYFSQGFLLFITYERVPEAWEIFKRFAKVFEQTYTRFLDLQKAEAQAREAKIEAALERVRSRTMAMQKSDELADVAGLMFQQVKDLGISTWTTGFNVWSDDNNTYKDYITSPSGGFIEPYTIDTRFFPSFKEISDAKKRGEDFYVQYLEGDLLKETYLELSKFGDKEQYVKMREGGFEFPLRQFDHFVFLSNISLMFITYDPVPEAHDLFKRFGKVFEQTYTRFLDLQKAEAQARDSQIEAALERVRSRTMAMQHSGELGETSFLLAKQVRGLGIQTWGCAFSIFDEDQKTSTEWFSNENGYLPTYKIPREGVFLRYYEAAQRGESLHVEEFEGETCIAHYKYLSTLPVLGDILKKYSESGVSIPTYQIDHVAYFKYGYLLFVTYQPIPEAHDIFKRFAKVFEQTYTRFLDLQKAEAQAREAQIEAALERVRSRTMAMQKSDELADVAGLMFQQVKELGIITWTTGFNVWSDDNSSYTDYVTSPLGGFVEPYTIDTTSFPTFKEISDAKKRGEDFYVQYLEGEMLKEAYLQLSKFGDKDQFVKIREGGFEFPTRQFDHFVFLSNISLMFITYDPVPEAHDVFKRFGKVFEQTYTRFLDLQKAEAQAREAKIDAALERVRSKTMAMHNSNDVGDTVITMFDELVNLGVRTNRCGVLIHSDSVFTEVWTAKSNQDGKAILIVGDLDTTIHPMLRGTRTSWMNKESFFSYELAGEDIKNYYKAINDSKNYPYRMDIDALPSKEIHSDFHFREGSIFAFTAEPIAQEGLRIFSRFAGVFGQTYTRFLDLQKAEAQTREAQIEAALERIRSRALAMHSSGDLIDVANVLREQMGLLGQPELESSIVHLYQDNSNTFEAWYAYRPPNLSSGKIITGAAAVPSDSSEWSKEVVEKYKSGDNEYTIVSSGEKIKEWYKVLEVIAPAVVEYGDDGQLVFPEILYYHFSKFSGGALLMISNQQPSVEARELQRRAAVVFGLAVTRFLDLKRTEEQAREAQIEASLERVRGKAMAMHSSEDLAATIGIFYRELESFSITPRRCGVGVVDKETRIAEISTMNTTDKGDSIEVIGKLKMEGHPVLEGIFDSWILQQEYHPVLRGNEIKEYYQLVRPQISFPEYPNDAVQFGYFFPVPELSVYAWTDKELAEDELKIYRKFTSVLSLTHKRYKDLKHAEFRAKEAVKQATLDRVRAEIASMRTKQDLDRITPLIWNELTILGIPFVRCGVFIMDDKHQQVHTFLSTPDGKAIAAFQLDYSVSNLKEAISHWHDRLVYVTHWGEIEFGELTDILMKQGSIASRDQYLNTLPTEGIHLHFLPFLQGMLYVGNTTRLQEDDIRLVQSLAEAFSTAYARYEDFNKLEAAKQQVDQALVELKQTQQQLVQSEKMASLGELTAGIAHEIQNPLNFVNNFAEVSNELIEEMEEEIKKGNFDEAKIIANDLKQNLEKINHHGKRADGIVKSMLQHSRTSSGQKELTDINVLCDEYLRLSYHGLRAKDKSFNAKFETDFDSTLEKINVIPQDIGRVILNLINNAFYAVTEKRNANLDDYEPTVSISTKQRDDKVEIAVKDNGNGIPQKVLDKIFQPFFTTKPTGQGTGLGLSLSYDILKAHGGELTVETKEGVGTEFSIQLPLS